MIPLKPLLTTPEIFILSTFTPSFRLPLNNRSIRSYYSGPELRRPRALTHRYLLTAATPLIASSTV